MTLFSWFRRRPNVARLQELRDVDGLLLALHERDGRVRHEAAVALGKLGDTRVIAPLIVVLRDGDARVRAGAIGALGDIGDPSVVKRLIECLQDPDPPVREAAKSALAALGSSATETLLAVLQSERGEARRSAIEVLGQIGDTRAKEPLVKVLGAREAAEREAAAAALDGLGWQPSTAAERASSAVARGQWKAATAENTEALAPLFVALQDTSSAGHQSNAALALGGLGDARAAEPLIAELEKLGGWRPAGPGLAEALKDPHLVIRGSLINGLQRLGESAVIPIIDACKHFDVMRQGELITVITKVGTAAVAPLLAALEDSDWRLRVFAAFALGELRDGRAVDPLVAALRDEHDDVRTIAASALAKLGYKPPSNVQFDERGKVTSAQVPPGEWKRHQKETNTYFSQEAKNLLMAAEALRAIGDIGRFTYYVVETPDGSLGRDAHGFYTEAPLKTDGIQLEINEGQSSRVESRSLTGFGDMISSQRTAALLTRNGLYSRLILLMKCGKCEYESPVETQSGPFVRQCYSCGAINTGQRGSITITIGTNTVEI